MEARANVNVVEGMESFPAASLIAPAAPLIAHAQPAVEVGSVLAASEWAASVGSIVFRCGHFDFIAAVGYSSWAEGVVSPWRVSVCSY